MPRKAKRARPKRNPIESLEMYRDFHGEDAPHLDRVTIPDLPREMWALGEVVSIVYKRPGERTPYEHEFNRPRPLLCSDKKGRRLYLVAGGYKVKAIGIVD